MDQAEAKQRIRDALEMRTQGVVDEDELSTTVDNHVALILRECDGVWDDDIAEDYVKKLESDSSLDSGNENSYRPV